MTARLKKFIKQIKDMASGVDSWWLWAIESLVGYGLGSAQPDWLLYTLLPVIYWHQQMEKAQNAKKSLSTSLERSIIYLYCSSNKRFQMVNWSSG
jgi:hypothetical protein